MSDGRKMWEAIRTLIPSKSTKKSTLTPSELEIYGSIVQNSKLIADKFGKHFSNIAPSIMNGTSLYSRTDYKRYSPNRVTESIFMQPTDPAEVFSSIMSLNSNKSCGVDYIPTKIVKLSASTVSYPNL